MSETTTGAAYCVACGCEIYTCFWHCTVVDFQLVNDGPYCGGCYARAYPTPTPEDQP